MPFLVWYALQELNPHSRGRNPMYSPLYEGRTLSIMLQAGVIAFALSAIVHTEADGKGYNQQCTHKHISPEIDTHIHYILLLRNEFIHMPYY